MESHVDFIPITYTGTNDEISKFSSKYNIEITESDRIGNGPENMGYVDRYIVDGIISKVHFKQIIDGLTIQDFDPLNKTVEGTVGVRPNSYLTQDESREIVQNIKDFMQAGVKRIIETSDTSVIKSAECRNVS